MGTDPIEEQKKEEIKEPAPWSPEDDAHLNKVDTTKVFLSDIHQFNFDPTLNVRDMANYEAAVERKVLELYKDKAIRTPLVVARLVSMKPEEKAIGVCGFLRSAALRQISIRDAEFYNENFKDKIPFVLHDGITERERIALLLDHGSEEELDEYEVYLSQKRLMRQKGMYSQRAMIAMLARLYYRLAGAKDRATYDLALKELREKGYTLKGKQSCKSWEDVAMAMFRGRFQKYQRIFESAPCVDDAFRKHVRGIAGGVDITFKMAEELHGMREDDAKKYLALKRTGSNNQKDDAKHWTKPILESAKIACKSHYLGQQLAAALGDQTAQAGLPDLEDELLMIERAKTADPEMFWTCVHEINARFAKTEGIEEDGVTVVVE
jgi:hypothetical protein